MYTMKVAYTDYEGNDREEEFRFNLNKAELLEMNMSVQGGMEKKLQRIIASKSVPEIAAMFKDIILRSYGEVSDDGRRFIKKAADGHNLADDFAQTEAYSEIYSRLLSDENEAAAFINGVIPRKLAEEISARG